MLSQLLKQRYQVVQVLSQGIFCRTYMAQDTKKPEHPTCIVKHFLPSSECAIPVEIRRRIFTREAEALKKLNNYDLVPHLLTHFEDNLEFYLVQEFIEGHPLNAEFLPGKRWSENKVFQLLQEVLGILNFVHSQGMIHRDIKPSNIIRRKQDNRLVLIDFGAVKPIWNQLIRGQENFIPVEYSTIAIGTPGYMPQEQQRGKPRPNSDIYALGIIAIQALTGVHPTQLPEDRNTGELIWQHLTQVNPQLASVLNNMVHYHFKDRYKSAKEVLEALLPLKNLYTPLHESDITLLSEDFTFEPQIPLSTDNTNEAFESEVSAQLLNNYTNDTTISIFPSKSALLMGLLIGAVSGLILMVVSYWSLQVIAPAQVENSQPKPSGLFH
ncbi:serine/threonine protein kinase [Hassallia byssoidea VB512170]|uniref:non-specific serine/threonine protein kinase n=1 Tax=Hassallia byssoidea VB512170 TaxID=1304833 RepID=A0A846HAM1_9CYAN|nr:serine/threonine-protein kinase [Hassalia byssoidea]NEU74123.1 serine/threonine protein kinase [Hassalia byssoidea VB512170]